MILISFSIALIALVFGAGLLAQSHKDGLHVLYKIVAWFVIVLSLLVMLCDVSRSCMRMCRRGNDGRMMMMRHQCMMRGGCDDRCMMNDGMGCPMMGRCNNGNNICNGNNSCGSMMNGGNCSDGMMNGGNGSCSGGMMSCPDSKGAMSGSCPMMGNMKAGKDTVKGKK